MTQLRFLSSLVWVHVLCVFCRALFNEPSRKRPRDALPRISCLKNKRQPLTPLQQSIADLLCDISCSVEVVRLKIELDEASAKEWKCLCGCVSSQIAIAFVLFQRDVLEHFAFFIGMMSL